MKLRTTLFAFSLASCTLFSQNIWHVNTASTAISPTGSSWGLAFSDLQTALALAHAGDEIWVAKGIYKPTDGTDRMVYFTMPNGVGLYGGFSGIETTRAQRNWETNATILSGDIGVVGDTSDNSYTVLYAFNTNAQTRLDGFTIENGNAVNPGNDVNGDSPVQCGGGVYLNGYGFVGTQLGIYNCTFRHNWARYQGGAIYANGKDGGSAIVRLDHCVFEQNASITYGGAVALENSSPQPEPLEITYCVFRENESDVEGGAIWALHEQAIIIEDCLFEKNITKESGNLFFGGKSTVFPIIVNRCNFYQNKLIFSGGAGSCMYFSFVHNPLGKRPIKVTSCKFWKNTGSLNNIYATYESISATFENCIFYENRLVFSLYSLSTSVKVDFAHCLFYNNLDFELSINNVPPGSVSITNSIFFDSLDTLNTPFVYGTSVMGTMVVKNCIVNQAACQNLSVESQYITCENVQFATDPLFVSPDTGPTADFHLQPCSPAINAGLDAILDTLGITTDFDGGPRVRNGRVDIGPYETNVFLAPDVVTMPSCAGASDGAFVLSGPICAPYSVVWDNLSETGTTLSGLSAGTYYLTITDANDLTIEETVVVLEPSELVLEATTVNPDCFGEANGSVTLATHGGTPFSTFPPYHYADSNPPRVGLGAGEYAYTVTDAHGCTAEVTANLLEPTPLAFSYTVQHASGPLNADGAIVFDSIFGGWGGAPTPADLFDLLPGNYGFTVTDSHGCTAIANITVGFTSDAGEPVEAFYGRVYPNPGFSDAPFYLETSEAVTVKVFDWLGRFMLKQDFSPGRGVLWLTGQPAGAYRLEIMGERGRAIKKCLVMGR